MKCFITGATGFIGSAVTELLLEKDHEVTGLTHSLEKTDMLRKKGVRPVVGDMREPQKWISSVKGTDAIIHTATIPVPSRPSKRYLKELKSAQETVVRSLVESATSCNVFVYTSGMTVYGSGNETRTEESEIDPVELAKPYVIGERLLMDAYEKNEFPVMILRPAGVYGDGGIFAKYWTTPISKGKWSTYPGNGKQVKSFISVKDCARAYVKAVDDPMPGEMFNVADDEPVAFGTFIRYLAEKMNAPKPFGIPAPIFRLLGGKILGEMLLTDMILSNKKMTHKLAVTLKYPTYREGITALANKYKRNHDPHTVEQKEENHGS
ncbi:NAD-dependent epimerase/dehydratase family protein [Halalkalibaculum sp. DA3122]|uniref:NAD-dependent epimerase/dehydratase family protein n=1 Tax=Halalkalibaculum sp. DA3122 TaxID=3373607 RepID=UPI003754FC75